MTAAPALLQILLVFVLVVVATSFKVHLGLAAALGGLALSLWRGLGIRATAIAVASEVFSADLILLVALMSLIMFFSSAMKKSKAMDRFAIAIVEAAPSRRSAMAIAPLLIGTLPVPGGAILSAPLLASMDEGHTQGGRFLAAANYWFRHTLELVWPLYPAFILTSSLTGYPTAKLAAINIYAPFAVFVLGLIFILPKSEIPGKDRLGKPKLRPFLEGVAPLGVVLCSYLLVSFVWSALAPFSGAQEETKRLIGRYIPIFAGLCLGCLYLWRSAIRASLALGSGEDSSRAASIFSDGIGAGTPRLLAVLVGVRIFSALLGVAGLPRAAAEELTSLGIPGIVAAALVPFIAGLVTGVGFGYVGLAFPIVIGLFPEGSPFPREAAIALACAWGYAGMMFSPLHVCMVVSAEHFNAGLPATIRRFALPLAIFLAVATAYSAILALVFSR
ncbi:MAG TPA: DUF401 family protein [Rectinemataceae bacterium]